MAGVTQKMGNALLQLRPADRLQPLPVRQARRREVGRGWAAICGAPPATFATAGHRWTNIGFNQQVGPREVRRPGHWNDPDMLEIGNGGMTDTEYQTHMSLWCMLAAPLLAGNDIRDMKDIEEILMNKEVIAIDQDKLGKQGTRRRRMATWKCGRSPWPTAAAVGLFNRGDSAATIRPSGASSREADRRCAICGSTRT